MSPGTPTCFLCPDAGWRDALDFEGSTYVGLVGRILRHLPFGEMSPELDERTRRPRPERARQPCCCSTATGPGEVKLMERDLPRHLAVLDPRTGKVSSKTALTH